MTGEELRDRRMATATSQAQLAEMLGVAQMAVAQWERDMRRLPDDLANRIKILLPRRA